MALLVFRFKESLSSCRRVGLNNGQIMAARHTALYLFKISAEEQLPPSADSNYHPLKALLTEKGLYRMCNNQLSVEGTEKYKKCLSSPCTRIFLLHYPPAPCLNHVRAILDLGCNQTIRSVQREGFRSEKSAKLNAFRPNTSSSV